MRDITAQSAIRCDKTVRRRPRIGEPNDEGEEEPMKSAKKVESTQPLESLDERSLRRVSGGARTAPVPNIPPIPGMCPGALVADE
jgi:hypothetical protein